MVATCDAGGEGLSRQGTRRSGGRSENHRHPACSGRGAFRVVRNVHAAEALIIQRVGKIVKTHSGVRTEFARLLKDASNHDKRYATVIVQAYKYKQLCDYGIGQAGFITDAEAEEAIANAEAFVSRIAEQIRQS